jgi:hypothetical protein
MGRFLSRLHEAWSEASSGPDAEIVGYAHIGVGILTAIILAVGAHMEIWLAMAAGVGVVGLLTGCLFHRQGVWIAAILGTILATGYAAGLGWFFGHIGRAAWWPWLGALAAGLVSFAFAASAYRGYIIRTRRV